MTCDEASATYMVANAVSLVHVTAVGIRPGSGPVYGPRLMALGQSSAGLLAEFPLFGLTKVPGAWGVSALPTLASAANPIPDDDCQADQVHDDRKSDVQNEEQTNAAANRRQDGSDYTFHRIAIVRATPMYHQPQR